MRKFIIAIAAGASALAVATPAAAQYYQPAPYGAPYGNAYGYGRANYGQVRSLQVRVNNLQRQIDRLAQRRAITRDEYNGLQRDARQVERRLMNNGRNGLSGREYADIQNRIQWLERRISNEVRDGNRWGRNDGYRGDRNWSDRDRDGRNDRYEDDRGRRHDGHRDRDDD